MNSPIPQVSPMVHQQLADLARDRRKRASRPGLVPQSRQTRNSAPNSPAAVETKGTER